MYEYDIEFSEPSGHAKEVHVKIMTLTSQDSMVQDAVIVVVEGLTCERIMGCALRRPDDPYNLFEGIRHAVNRLPISQALAQHLFLSICRHWTIDFITSEGPFLEQFLQYCQMLGETFDVVTGGI